MLGQRAVETVNSSLETDDHVGTIRALHSPALQLPATLIQQNADRFYHGELRSMRHEKQVCLHICLCLSVCLSLYILFVV